MSRLRCTLQRRTTKLAIVATLVLLLLYVILEWQVPVDHINTQGPIPQGLLANPVFAAAATNDTTGDVSLSLQSFNYTSSDGTVNLFSTSAVVGVTITPQGQSSRLDLNVQLDGVNIKSPSFSGAFSSAKLTGYVLVDPTTNKLVLSLVASTSVVDIIRAVLGV